MEAKGDFQLTSLSKHVNISFQDGGVFLPWILLVVVLLEHNNSKTCFISVD